MPDKAKIYQQIQQFNIGSYNPNNPSDTVRQDQYHFVNSEFAKERGNFFKFILETTPIKELAPKSWRAIDLAYGSGSLTSHLLFESGKEIERVIFNDKNKDEVNPYVTEIDHAEVTYLDFLDKDSFPNEQFNLIIFNPQIGSSGDTRFISGLDPIDPAYIVNAPESLQEYLEKNEIDINDLDFNLDAENRIFEVTSAKLNNKTIEGKIGNTRIYNYHEVKYKSKQSSNWQNKNDYSKIIRFRQTFDKLFDKEKGVLVFYGTLATFKTLFSDFEDFGLVFELCSPESKAQNLFIATKAIDEQKHFIYKKDGDSYIEVDSCKTSASEESTANLDELEDDISNKIDDLHHAEEHLKLKAITTFKVEEPKFEISSDKQGRLNFPYKNILLKGVPGTGKSRLVNKIIKDKLSLSGINHPNVLRVNIHTGSSNSELMQGIGITANSNGQVEYHEKTGLILHHLKEAISKPNQPFVIVLEEIQENSLNELIGDLIYLIEEGKRVDLAQEILEGRIETDREYQNYETFLNELIAKNENLEYVKVPYLVHTETKFRKLIFPANLYMFCTSNYREDKKVVEDNLMRRFDLIELYPKYDEGIYADKNVPDFLKNLNDGILEQFKEKEIHPDRFMIGHANWLSDKVNDPKTFCRALLKAIVEFKDIREIEWHELQPILKQIEQLPFGHDVDMLNVSNYKELIDKLQEEAFGDFIHE